MRTTPEQLAYVEPAEGKLGTVATAGSTLEERSRERRSRLVANRAAGFAEAEAWDLDYWQQRTPEERLSAFVALRRDVALVEAARVNVRQRRP